MFPANFILNVKQVCHMFDSSSATCTDDDISNECSLSATLGLKFTEHKARLCTVESDSLAAVNKQTPELCQKVIYPRVHALSYLLCAPHPNRLFSPVEMTLNYQFNSYRFSPAKKETTGSTV